MSSVNSTSHSSRVPSSNAEDRFHGVLTVSRRKVFQRIMYDYISHIYINAPDFRYFIYIIDAWRILQWFIPSLSVGNSLLYKDEFTKTYAQILSVFTNLIPVGLYYSYFFPIALVYFFICFLIIIYIYLCAKHYHTYNKIHKIHRYTCFILMHGPMQIIHPIMSSLLGYQIGYNIIQGASSITNPINWISAVLILITFSIFMVYYHQQISVCVPFCRVSLPGYLWNNQLMIMLITSIVCFTSAIAPFCPKPAQYALIGSNIACYIIIIPLFTSYAIFIHDFHYISFFATSLVGAAHSIVSIVFIAISKPIPYVILIIVYPLLIILAAVGKVILSRSNMKAINVLDEIVVDASAFDTHLRTLMKTAIYSGLAFRFGHPSLQNWKMIRMATERWPYSSYLWFLWSRYASAYPEDLRLLGWINDQLLRISFGSSYFFHVRLQVYNIMRYRDSSMSLILRKRISDCQRFSSISVNRYRSFWECVLQGNINDVQISDLAASEAWEKARDEIEGVMSSYPNNHFAVRTYNRFLQSTHSNPLTIHEWTSRYQRLKTGQRIFVDMVQYNAALTFPLMANVYTNVRSDQIGTRTEIIKGDATIDSTIKEIENSELVTNETTVESNKPSQDDSLMLSLTNALENMRTPTITKAIICSIVITVLIFGIYFPILSGVYIVKADASIELMQIAAYSSELGNAITSAVTYSVMSMFVKLDIFDKYLSNPNEPGYSKHSKEHMENTTLVEHIRSQVERSESAFSMIRKSSFFKEQGGHAYNAFQYLFEGVEHTLTYEGDYTNPTIVSNDKSIEALVVSMIMICINISTIETKADAELMMTKTLNPINMYNSQISIIKQLRKVIDELSLELQETNTLTHFVMLYCSVGMMVISLILYGGAMGWFLFRMKKDIEACVLCFLMLPKHIVSEVNSTFIKTAKNEINNIPLDQAAESLKRRHDENVIITLAASNANSWVYFKSYILCGVSMAILLIVTNVLSYAVYQTVTNMDQAIKSYSDYASNFLTLHTYLATAVASMYRVSSLDFNIAVPLENRGDALKIAADFLDRALELYNIVYFSNNHSSIYEIDPETAKLAFIDPTQKESGVELHSIYSNTSFISQTSVLMVLLANRILKTDVVTLANDDGTLRHATHLLDAHLYDEFYKKSAYEIPLKARNDHSQNKKTIIAILIPIILFAFIILGVIIFLLTKIRHQFLSLLKPLIMIPPTTVVSNRDVMRLLSGEAPEKRKATGKYDHTFFDPVVEKMKFLAVIITDTNLTITSQNEFATELFGDVQGKEIKHIIKGKCDAFYNELESAISGRRGYNFTRNVEAEIDGKTHHFSITLAARTSSGHIETNADSTVKIESYVFIIGNITKDVQAQKDYEEAAEKVHSLLLSILPPAAVAQYEAREEERISFTASSVSIVAISFVDFLIQKQSLSPMQLMTALERAFEAFDQSLAGFRTITRIQATGQSYMAAGGLFSTTTVPPDVHAKEAVSFALDCLNKIKKLNQELSTNIRVRIAVNTGGPVVAGILAVERPIFGVFGASVSATMMLHQVIDPMHVCVTRYIYELIYGPSFTIKDFGERQIGGQKIPIYVVQK